MRYPSLIPLGGAALAAMAVSLLPPHLDGFSRAVFAYDVGAAVMIAIEWIFYMHRDAKTTRSRAALDDPGRVFVGAVTTLSGAFGLVAAIAIIGRASAHDGRLVQDLLAMAAILLGWLLIQTTYTYRYAHYYYRDREKPAGPDKGLEFPGNAAPSDFDFAYFSFVIGMTFQVSDVQITSPALRRVALGQALIAFAYNISVLAFSVNALAGILQGK